MYKMASLEWRCNEIKHEERVDIYITEYRSFDYISDMCALFAEADNNKWSM